MRGLCQTIFMLSRFKEIGTDGQTDDVITIGHPHLQCGALIIKKSI